MSNVAILMGSESDRSVMKATEDVLDQMGVDYETHVISAHRNPEQLMKYVTSADEKGIKVFIAGAGGAAALPGAIASWTSLPVIGVPVASSELKGIDALYAIVQMPPGIPVATVAIGGGKNAGLLAAEILALSDLNLDKKLIAYRKNLHDEVVAKDARLVTVGSSAYLAQM